MNRFEFERNGEQWPSLYKGKNWSDPANKAWTSFPWEDIKSNGPEKDFIVQLWNNYTGGKVWPMSSIKTSDATKKSDTGKFLFFDIFNLAPTLGEYRGYTGKTLPNYPAFFESYKSTIAYKRTETDKSGKETVKTGWIYNGNISMSDGNQFKTFEGDKLKLRSAKFNTENYFEAILKDSDIDYEKMLYPSEEEYKLSWMRELVEYGVEARMGPFAWSGKNEGGKNVPVIGTNGIYTFQVGDMEHLFKQRYSTSKTSYQYGYLFNWAKMELDWAKGKYQNTYGINEFYPKYEDNPFFKTPVSYLESISKGQFKLTREEEGTIAKKIGDKEASGIRPGKTSFASYPTRPMNEAQFIIIELGNSGKTKTSDRAKPSDLSTPWQVEDIKVDFTGQIDYIGGIGIPPHFATPEDKDKYIVSGWVVIPEIFGDHKLPWPFVWKYIGMVGFFRYCDIVKVPKQQRDFDLAKLFYEDSSPLGFGGSKISSFNEYDHRIKSDNLQRYNYRLKHWWYKYDTKNIPERELVFYLRMKYGLSHAVGLRYLAYNDADSIFKDILEIMTIFGLFITELAESLITELTPWGKALLLSNASDVFSKKWFEPLAVFTNWQEVLTKLKKDKGLYSIHTDRITDSMICGGLPKEYRYKDKLITKADIDKYYQDLLQKRINEATEGKIFNIVDYPQNLVTIPGALQTKSDNLYNVRSMYLSQAQDVVGWQRWIPTSKDYQPPTQPYRRIEGTAEEVVKWGKAEPLGGYYTFNGHGTDRLPFASNKTYLKYKRVLKSDIRINDLAISNIVLKEEKKIEGDKVDSRDRFRVPEQLQSYNWAKLKGVVAENNTKIVEPAESDKVYYYNHNPTNPTFSVRDEFHPALLSPKELQFVYECVSYVLYGNTPVTKDSTGDAILQPSALWRLPGANGNDLVYNYFKNHRWAELDMRINVPLGNLNSAWKYSGNIGGVSDAPASALFIDKQSLVTLADYILWMSPTEDQFYKTRFSNYDHTFIKRTNEYPELAYLKNEPHLLNGNLSKQKSDWEDLYPFHAFAKQIVDSENSTIPIVPALVHHRYISRKMNNNNKYFSGTNLEARGINFMDIDNFELSPTFINTNIRRAMGGKDFQNKDFGVLIGLPTFVLGGRKDLGETDDSWDKNWGNKCPFFINKKDGQLMVDNFDEVIDSWATNKLHNGKHVSAMEIMFWIRYRHGLAAAPSTKRVEHFIGNDIVDGSTYTVDSKKIKNVWPPFLQDFYIHNSAYKRLSNYNVSGETFANENQLLPNETLHNIEMATSYYSPIIVDQYSYTAQDPLIEIDTNPVNNNEYNAYTGFNSYYGCYWPGANYVTGVRKAKFFKVGGDWNGTGNFGTDYPSTSVLKTEHTIHYYWIHQRYREIERGETTGWKSTADKSLVTGFDPHENLSSCKRVIIASDIQSWFRAYRLIQEMEQFSEYIERGLKLKEGETDSVLAVQGTEVGDEKGSVAHFYISGEGVQDKKITTLRKKEPMTFSERMRVRPWFERLEASAGVIQNQGVNLCDDYNFGTRGCIPQTVYLRHILMPNVFMYVTGKEQFSKPGGFYTKDQVDKTLSVVHKAQLFWTKPLGYELGTYFATPSTDTSDSKTKTSLSYSERASGLALQSVVLSTMSSKWTFDLNSNKRAEIRTRAEQLINHYLLLNKNKQVWNIFVGKLFFTFMTSVSNIGTYANLDKLNVSTDVVQTLTLANTAITNNYSTLVNISRGAESIYKIGNDEIFKKFKIFLDLLAAGAYGWKKPNSLPDPEGRVFAGLLTAEDYKNSKAVFKFYREQIFSYISKALIQRASATIATETSAFIGEQAALRALTTKAFLETAEGASVALGGTIATGGAVLIISIIVAAAVYTVEMWLEQYELHTKYLAMWQKINEANSRGYLEGPYLQSDGNLIIKKTETGEIPILGKTYTVSEDQKKNKESIPTSKEFKTRNLETMDNKQLIEFVTEQNRLFYEDGGRLDQILNDISKDDCECKFFKSLFESQESRDIGNLQDWDKGPYKRRFFDRKNVIDEAPNVNDMPLTFYRAQQPSGDTAYQINQLRNAYSPYGEVASSQQSRNRTAVYIRDTTRNGTRVSENLPDTLRCPRFWWPDILVQGTTDLCQYMAMDGKYPSAEPSMLRICNPSTEEGLKEIKNRLEVERLLSSGPNIGDYNFGFLPKNLSGNPTERFQLTQDSAIQKYFNRYIRRDFTKFGGRVGLENGDLSKIVYNTKNSSFFISDWRGINKSHKSQFLYTYKSTTTNQINYTTTIGNDYLGTGRITSEGLLGPAPPHEREIINIFRKKYKIDIVLPRVWNKIGSGTITDPDPLGRYPNQIFNPYKYASNNPDSDMISASEIYQSFPSNCCAMGEVLTDTNFDGSAIEKNRLLATENNLLARKRNALYCEYLITLNTKKFIDKIMAKCSSSTTEDRTNETKRFLTEDAPVPKNPDPKPDDLKTDRKIPDCYSEDCSEDPTPHDEPKQKNPRIPKCKNCPPSRKDLVGLRRILPSLIQSTGILRASWNISSDVVYFNGIVLPSPTINARTSRRGGDSTPLLPNPDGDPRLEGIVESEPTPNISIPEPESEQDTPCPPGTTRLGSQCIPNEIIFDVP